MKVLDPGHLYELNILDGPPELEFRTLKFVKREGPKYPGNVGSYPGTTSQEVLRALIDRALYVNQQEPHVVNHRAITDMKTIVWLFEQRAAQRHGRDLRFGVHEAVYGETCSKCNHVCCKGDCHS
jgi:hypothetical protein